MERDGSRQMLGDRPEQLQVPVCENPDGFGLDLKSAQHRGSADKVAFVGQPHAIAREAGDASARAFSISRGDEKEGGKASTASGPSDAGGAHLAKLDDSGDSKDALDSTIDGDGADNDVLDELAQEEIIEVSWRWSCLV